MSVNLKRTEEGQFANVGTRLLYLLTYYDQTEADTT